MSFPQVTQEKTLINVFLLSFFTFQLGKFGSCGTMDYRNSYIYGPGGSSNGLWKRIKRSYLWGWLHNNIKIATKNLSNKLCFSFNLIPLHF